MTTCIVLSALFLIMYVAYHMTSESTKYGGEGILRYIYFFILITHIALSIIIIPLVLKTYSKAYLKDFETHRKWAKYTFPIWLYVAVTGVVVYFMISPYYVHWFMKTRLSIVLLFLVFLSPQLVDAQCAMCRAVVESEGNPESAEALNDGIVYLMAIPYILVAGLFFFIYRKMRK